MRYELKILNAAEENGKIDLARLSHIAEGIQRIAEGALQIRLRGISVSEVRKKESLNKSLKITLNGLKKGGTILCLESDKFENTLPSTQINILRGDSQLNLLTQTPMSLFIASFDEAINGNGESELLDKSLLKELKNFKKSFLGKNEVFQISNEKSIDSLELSESDFDKIKILEQKIPAPEPIVLNGIVEESKYGKLRVKLLTDHGVVDGFLADSLDAEDISAYWGKEVTISGINHYKPDRLSIIEIQKIYEPLESDKYFSKKPKKSSSTEQQILNQLNKKSPGDISKIIGKWPGEESFDDLIEML